MVRAQRERRVGCRDGTGASSIGYSVRGGRSAPQSPGYTIDIDGGAARKLRELIESCLGPP